jgi:phosphoribosylaminoimidazole-succinocarboxamide synthase
MITDDLLRAQLSRTLFQCDLPGELGRHYEGKVRDNYTTGDGKRIIVVSDRISAFDRVLGTIPFKGQVLNQLAAYWFEVTRTLAPNHLLSVPDPQVTVARECTPLPVELVMRGYLTGVTTTSIWYAYERGARTFCGHELPSGMRKNQPLPRPLLTPSTKAEKGGHDESVSRRDLLARGLLSEADFDAAAAMCERLFAFGVARARERGLILVDTKYEIGRDPAGQLVFIDEIHTPDSSRYWYADDYEARLAKDQEPRALDKEYVRRWLVENRGYRGEGPPPELPDEVRVEAARRYVQAYEQVTGRAFQPDPEEPMARIRRNLGLPEAGR